MSEFRDKISSDREFAFKVAWEMLKDPGFEPPKKDFGDLEEPFMDFIFKNPSPEGSQVVLENLSKHKLRWFGNCNYVGYLLKEPSFGRKREGSTCGESRLKS